MKKGTPEARGCRVGPNKPGIGDNLHEHIDDIRKIHPKYISWVEDNFTFWSPFDGMVEELGELAHVYLKLGQGIRNKTEEDAIDAVCDIVVFMMHYCYMRNIPFDVVWLKASHLGLGDIIHDYTITTPIQGIAAFTAATAAFLLETAKLRRFIQVQLTAIESHVVHRQDTTKYEEEYLAKIIAAINYWIRVCEKDFGEEFLKVLNDVIARDWIKDPITGGRDETI